MFLKNANMTVISLNGMIPFIKNKADLDEATVMLDWLEATLASSTGKFMLMTHVYPANNYFGNLEVFWKTEYS